MIVDSMPRLLVLIPSFNDQRALSGCLESLRGEEADIVVIDDASTDGSAELVRRRFPGVELIVNASNQGFARTCNRGFLVALSRGVERILLLNQDTRVSPGLCRRLAETMEAHPRAAIVAPKTYSFERSADGRERLIYNGSWRTLLPLRQRIPGIERGERAHSAMAVETDYAWGHGMLIRASALREVGAFDTSFAMYYEDLDLCQRVRDAGHEIWYEPAAVMWHDVADGARALKSEPWRWAHKVRSTGVFHRKHYGRMAALVMTPLTLAAELRQLLFHGRFRAARHLASAILESWLARASSR